jgi:apolipoprotein N-acyltransferase
MLMASYCWSSLESRNSTQLRVATVSPGYRYKGDMSDLVNMTRIAHNDGARFIVWPEEYVYPDHIRETCEEFVQHSVAPALAGIDAYVVVGCMQLSPALCPTANLAVTLSPDGRILGSYGKQHPVSMIGELSCLRNGYRNYPIEDNPGLQFSTLICYDTDFEDSSAILADKGVSLILNPSEDWAAARSHFAASVFRAVENRVAIAKADWGWDSAIIRPDGSIAAMYNSLTIHREILVSDVPVYAQESSMNQVRHSLFPTSCMLVCIAMVIHSLYSRRSRRDEIGFDMGERLLT